MNQNGKLSKRSQNALRRYFNKLNETQKDFLYQIAIDHFDVDISITADEIIYMKTFLRRENIDPTLRNEMNTIIKNYQRS